MHIKSVIAIVFALLSMASWGQTLRDPTTPLFQRAVSQGSVALSLAAIIDGDGHRFAIINDLRCVVGDVVGGAKIIEIQSNAVVYEYKSKLHTLKMRESVIN